ncbi:MAG: ISKra4 family transposase, partial [Chlamydiales bacterium]|nr:ISKra4 family transposase [Chlamydiales bacterium]
MENRKNQFDYQDELRNNLPTGSGEIESGNRSVIQKRLKTPGAWWSVSTAEYMLALRCLRINGDWRKYWRQVD